MERQLVLLETADPAWKLDDATRELGRRNVAKARQVLAAARAAAHAAAQAADRAADRGHPHAA